LRRQVPVPLHGASTRTRSKAALCFLTHGSFSDSIGWVSILWNPARRKRSPLRVSRHQGRQCERFAPGSGAKIDDALAGLGVDQQGDDLRSFILNFDRAFF
jgi:hypothetical protein